VLLSAITATTIADFQHARHDAGGANRTINMDVGVLSRVLKFCGRWRALARDVDLVKRLVHVRRSKNETSHRVIPLNASAIEAAARMFERADLLGHTEPEHYLWPACQWGRYDATNPMLKWDTAWCAQGRGGPARPPVS
jgi:hypothetical protein